MSYVKFDEFDKLIMAKFEGNTMKSEALTREYD